jgi:3-methyladenine DNA glycosylase Tag
MECMNLCLNETDVAARRMCIMTLHECACICKEAASFMSMDSKHAMDLCKLCETICTECAQACGMFKDDHCKKCAAECQTCANECKMMAGM